VLPQHLGSVKGHVPQLWATPQESLALPQTCKAEPQGLGSIGVQPQTLGTPPPPQLWGEKQRGPQITG
jgi:hypothetical protein